MGTDHSVETGRKPLISFKGSCDLNSVVLEQLEERIWNILHAIILLQSPPYDR